MAGRSKPSGTIIVQNEIHKFSHHLDKQLRKKKKKEGEEEEATS